MVLRVYRAAVVSAVVYVRKRVEFTVGLAKEYRMMDTRGESKWAQTTDKKLDLKMYIYASFVCASWTQVINARLTSSPKFLSPRDSDLSVSFVERASPKDAASTDPKGCPEARSSTKEVFLPKALEKAATSDNPNFLVLRMHMVLACFHRRVEVCQDMGECQSCLTCGILTDGFSLVISTGAG